MGGAVQFQLGRVLAIAGLVLLVIGIIVMVGSRFSFFGLGRLPGDIAYKGKRVQFYFPLVTCIVLSLAATLVLWVVALLTRK